MFGIFLCFDDPDYLIQNINSEKDFYNKTSHLNLPYFNLSKGVLFRSEYNEETEKFRCNGSFQNKTIYQY